MFVKFKFMDGNFFGIRYVDWNDDGPVKSEKHKHWKILIKLVFFLNYNWGTLFLCFVLIYLLKILFCNKIN